MSAAFVAVVQPDAAFGQAPSARILIDHVNILDGRGGPVAKGRVLIEGQRIAQVLPENGPAPADTTIIDGQDGYLVPGFIDMHAHLMQPRCAADDSATQHFDRAVSEQQLSTLLDFGITTVRSPATPTIEGLRLRDDLNAGAVRGPRAFASAELINDAKLTDQQLRNIVRDAMPYRPDYFKVYARLSPQAVGTVIDEAHRHGIPVIGHLGRTSWLEAAQLGIDHLAHTVDWSPKTLTPENRKRYLELAQGYNAGSFLARIDWLELLDLSSVEVKSMVAEVAKRGISVDLTLIAYDTKFAAPHGGRYANNRFAKIVPALYHDWTQCRNITSTDDWSEQDYRRWNAAYPKLQTLVLMMRDAGVLLTTGTDLTNPWIIPGESLHQEFELLVAAGLSPSVVLKMTGENASRALRSNDVGLIQPGRFADLVLLTNNPLDNIANTRAIRWVMRGGQLVSRGPQR
ncbi:amidohydrolase family protein [Bradyrhizobium guangzhouense]|nr:amidohydrolase family protein [Bradyrhizobium guangzhouense]